MPVLSSLRVKEVGLAGASLILMLGSLEAGLLLYHWTKVQLEIRRLPPVSARALVPSQDPELIYEFNPGFVEDGFSVNSLGMPDEEVRVDAPEAGFRIAFVGDSISANFGHRPRHEIYLERIAAELSRKLPDSTRVESLNLGVNGYGIRQLVRMARTRALALQPDVLVAQLCLNDPYPSNTAYVREAPRPPLRLWTFILLRLWPERYWAEFYVRWRHDQEGWRRIREGLTGLAEIDRAGTPVVAVLFPYLYAPGYDQWQFAEIHREYEALAEELDLRFVDLRPVFEEAGLIQNVWPVDPIHPDAEGHRVAGQEILRRLEQWGLLPELQRDRDARHS